MMFWLVVFNRLIQFIRFYFTVRLSEPFLQLVAEPVRPQLPLVSGSKWLGDGRS